MFQGKERDKVMDEFPSYALLPICIYERRSIWQLYGWYGTTVHAIY